MHASGKLKCTWLLAAQATLKANPEFEALASFSRPVLCKSKKAAEVA